MTFRDNRDALHEREKAELRDKLDRERTDRERLAAEVQRLQHEQAKDAHEDYIRSLKEDARPFRSGSGVFAGLWNILTSSFRLFASFFAGVLDAASRIRPLFWVFALVLIGGIALFVHHEFYDIRDGYITDKTYVPGHWTESCSGTGSNRTCTQVYNPPTWSVTITFQHRNASWGVSESEYNSLSYGEWYCARDVLHDAPCRRDNPAPL